MLGLRKVAVTGGLSCGKSSVCQILKEFGAYTISADDIVHRLLSSNKNIIDKVVELMGESVLVNHQINRSRVAERVFRSKVLLKALEELLHPYVFEEINDHYQKCRTGHFEKKKLFVAEVPLLFESGKEKDFDSTVTVVSDPELCMQWYQEKAGVSKDAYRIRMANQMPQLEKAVRAHYVIMNSSPLENLREVVKELYCELVSVQ